MAQGKKYNDDVKEKDREQSNSAANSVVLY